MNTTHTARPVHIGPNVFCKECERLVTQRSGRWIHYNLSGLMVANAIRREARLVAAAR